MRTLNEVTAELKAERRASARVNLAAETSMAEQALDVFHVSSDLYASLAPAGAWQMKGAIPAALVSLVALASAPANLMAVSTDDRVEGVGRIALGLDAGLLAAGLATYGTPISPILMGLSRIPGVIHGSVDFAGGIRELRRAHNDGSKARLIKALFETGMGACVICGNMVSATSPAWNLGVAACLVGKELTINLNR